MSGFIRGGAVAFWIAVIVLLIVIARQGGTNLDMQKRWDEDPTSHPAAAMVLAGRTEEAEPSITAIDDGWAQCALPGKNCDKTEIRRYPAVYTIGSLELDKNGCYTATPGNRVTRLSAASTKGGASYTVRLSSDSTVLRICIKRKPPHKDDAVVIWSDWSKVK